MKAFNLSLGFGYTNSEDFHVKTKPNLTKLTLEGDANPCPSRCPAQLTGDGILRRLAFVRGGNRSSRRKTASQIRIENQHQHSLEPTYYEVDNESRLFAAA